VTEIIECEEFGEIELGIDRLLVNGEIKLDNRIVEKGFLNISLVKGQVKLRADRHVGLIPLNEHVSIRVKPRATVANIAHMIVKSGEAPFAIPDFSRGYLPNFEVGANIERIYCGSLVGGLERVVAGGLMKSYVEVASPPPWRGRLLVSDTIKRHRSRNVRYRGEFDFRTLSHSGLENVALKHAGKFVRDWLVTNDGKGPLLPRLNAVLRDMDSVPDFDGRLGPLLQGVARAAGRLSSHQAYYRDPLWTAYVILQGKVPDLAQDGFVTLDSLIVDLSRVFEAYIRQLLIDRATPIGWRIVNGDKMFYPFFTDGKDYRVKPDIVIVKDGQPIAIVDAKYKLEPKEADRYEVLAFMDALGVTRGGFVLPARPESASRYMGATAGGKILSDLRFDLAAVDMDAEADRFVANLVRLVGGSSAYA
jgi:hypothetical protein